MGCPYTEKGINIGTFKLQGKGCLGLLSHPAGRGNQNTALGWCCFKPAKAGDLGAADETNGEVQKQGMRIQPGCKKELDKLVRERAN